MAEFAPVLELATLDGATGFRLDGVTAGDFGGRSVSSAGDVNGDGFGDLIIGAFRADPNGSASGASYVVFGKASGFTARFDLSKLDGAIGFIIRGEAIGDYSGQSVSNAGDVNGDGFADLIIGARGADPNGTFSGASYVVFGKASGFAADLDLSTLDGAIGFEIRGEAAGDQSGYSVSSAGDVNSDGFDDLIIGANVADPHRDASGASYVVFGKALGFAATLDLSTLDGVTGFEIRGEAAGDFSGASVSSAGDVNGDGFADLIIGSNGADPNGKRSGASYVVFGKASGFTRNLDLSSLDGLTGFEIRGEAARDYAGRSASSAGDINGDGFDDLLIGARGADPNGGQSGASYVVFGKAGGFAATVELSALDGGDGFEIRGEAIGDSSGFSVSTAGDVNGDGFDDLIIGAFGADPNGNVSGASYVVFGKASDFAATLELSTLDGSNGFRLDGVMAFEFSGVSVSGAGDVNGDGFDDLIIGADGAGFGGKPGSGASYVVFGRAPEGPVKRQGSEADQEILGGGARDTLSGLGGDDTLTGGGANDRLDGGLGDDVLEGGGGDDVLQDHSGNNTLIGGAGGDRLFGGADDDTFVFLGLGDSRTAGDTRDRLYNFVSGDTIDLSAIDADRGANGDQAFVLEEGGGFAAGEIMQKLRGDDLLVRLNVDADRDAEMSFLVIDRARPLSEADFDL